MNIHTPVLLSQIKKFLLEHKLKNKVFFDATLGGGGYTELFLNFGSCVSCDLDIEAIKIGTERFSSSISNHTLTLIHSSFDKALSLYEDEYFDCIVADLGYSSNQLEFSGKGFSYLKTDEPLDLRYNTKDSLPCWHKIICVKDVDKLRKTIFTYSGESHSKRIAEEIFLLRQDRQKENPITVGETVEAITRCIPQKERKHTNSILSRVWQALRIWTNNEFEILDKFLDLSINKVKHNGYIIVVTFHSLEDKHVTKFMRKISRPYSIDDFGNKQQDYQLITKKQTKPSSHEIEENPRSRSASMRILKKL